MNMKFIKKNINKIVLIGVIVLAILGVIVAKITFSPNESKAIYGSRLNGKSKVQIKDEDKKKIEESIKGQTKDIDIRVPGRIIEIMVTANDDVTLEVAKDFGTKIIESISEDKKAYYDIQLMIKNDANEAQFPIIGYKHHTNTSFSWTKDRTES